MLTLMLNYANNNYVTNWCNYKLRGQLKVATRLIIVSFGQPLCSNLLYLLTKNGLARKQQRMTIPGTFCGHLLFERGNLVNDRF